MSVLIIFGIISLASLLLKLVHEFFIMIRINEASRQYGTAQYNVITYWRDFFRGIVDMRGLLREKYLQNPDTPFVIRCIYFGPLVLIPPKLNPEFRSAPESQLSARSAQVSVIQPWYMVPDPTWDVQPTSPYRAGFNRMLNRATDADLPTTAVELARLCDEILMEPTDEAVLEQSEWKELKLQDALITIISTKVSQLYVGEKLAQDREYVQLLLSMMRAILTRVWVINLFPESTKPLVSHLVCLPIWKLRRRIDRMYLGKYIREKQEMLSNDKTMESETDFATFVVKKASRIADKRFAKTENMLSRILLQHFPAIHTTGSILSAVINYLIEYPDHGERLRKEALRILTDPKSPKTWTVGEVGKLEYHDRFIAEILRLEPLLYAPSRRACVQSSGYTFSDGTHIPYGFGVALATDQIHLDPRFWENPFQFNPDRWRDRVQVLPCTGDSDYLAFGTGRHVW